MNAQRSTILDGPALRRAGQAALRGAEAEVKFAERARTRARRGSDLGRVVDATRETKRAIDDLTPTELTATILRLMTDAPHFLETLQRMFGARPRPTPSRQYTAEFHRAMSTLEEHVGQALAARAVRAWHEVSAATEPPEPIIESTQEGGVRFAWSTESTYLDLEVYEDGTFEWFFDGRSAGETDGTESEREVGLPAGFLARLADLHP